jgi:alcohol dehydrogenase (cytochrome c)
MALFGIAGKGRQYKRWLPLTLIGGVSMKRRNKVLVSALALVVLSVLALYLTGWSPFTLAGVALNTVRSANNPPGSVAVEVNGDSAATSLSVANSSDRSLGPGDQPSDAGSWSGYNRTLTSQRYSPLSQINTKTARGLKVLCTYDTHQRESFETGPIMVHGALIFTTVFDVVSIDPSNCQENWRTHENYKAGFLLVNRGAAYLNGRLFRGTIDGRVLAYDFKTGMRLWATTIADPKTGEVVDAAPIAWNGLVFIGNSLGDFKGVKGRMYALAAETGAIVWETYLVPRAPNNPTRGPQGLMPPSAITTWKNTSDVPITGGGTWTSYTLDPATGRLYVPVGNPAPAYVSDLREGANLFTDTVVALDAKTGNYINHFPMAPTDWHDWDVSNTPSIFVTKGGRQLLSFSPKNGYLYGFDLATSQLQYRSPVTRMENVDVPFSTDKATHFCPGTAGGGEWNGVAYDPETNLVFTGEAEWCTTVTPQTDEQVKAIPYGQTWVGHVPDNRLETLGRNDPHANWAGWLYATDADSGQWKWRLKSNYPILSGVTPTAGGIVIFADMGGNLYVVNASNGQRLWDKKLESAIGGGVITYSANGSQKVAVAVGVTSVYWPTEQATARIVILGLGEVPQ